MRSPEATRTMFEGLKSRWTFLNDYQRDTLVTLADLLEKIGPTACRVLLLQAERLAIGRERYNDDFDQPRVWLKETSEELLDGMVYLTVDILKKLEEDRERGGESKSDG